MNYEEKVNEAVNGNIKSLPVLAELKQQEKRFKSLIEEIMPTALDEAETYEKNFTMDGYSFEKKNGATRYDFKCIPEWAEKHQELKAIELKAKAAYNSYKQGLTTSTDDGEVIALPKVMNNRDSLTIKPLNK